MHKYHVKVTTSASPEVVWKPQVAAPLHDTDPESLNGLGTPGRPRLAGVFVASPRAPGGCDGGRGPGGAG
jgi:hypothetical protein